MSPHNESVYPFTTPDFSPFQKQQHRRAIVALETNDIFEALQVVREVHWRLSRALKSTQNPNVPHIEKRQATQALDHLEDILKESQVAQFLDAIRQETQDKIDKITQTQMTAQERSKFHLMLNAIGSRISGIGVSMSN